MIILTCAALISGFLVAWKIRNLKAQFVEGRKESLYQLLTSVGEIESLKEAERRAPAIVEIMKRYDAIALILPLKSGGRVNFQLGSAGLKIEGK